MNLLIPEKWESFIRSKLQSGQYASEDEVIDAALHLLEENDSGGDPYVEDAQLEALLLAGLDSGTPTPMTAEDWEWIKSESKRMTAERKVRKEQ